MTTYCSTLRLPTAAHELPGSPWFEVSLLREDSLKGHDVQRAFLLQTCFHTFGLPSQTPVGMMNT